MRLKTIFIYFNFLLISSVYGQQCLDVDATSTAGASPVTVDCNFAFEGEVCVDLEVSYTEMASTESYDFASIPYNPVIPFNQGAPLIPNMPLDNGVVDDKFSEAIPLGFSFCFYDQNFTEIVIGTNGILTFDLEEAGADAPSGISVTNPNPALIDNAIFAVQHDLIFDTSTSSEIYYSTIGTAPCRQFVVNFYEAAVFGCPGKSTIQVVLHEFTNEIEVHILDKPEHCDNGRNGNALLGIMNGDGTQGVSPPNRNTGEWGASNESWSFFPTGNTPPEIVWYDDNGEIVGNGEQISVCPTRNTTYTVEVQYQSCEGNTLFGTDQINVNYAAEFPIVENDSIYICDEDNNGSETITLADLNGTISLNSINNFIFTYYASESDANNLLNPITTLTVTEDTVFYVRIANATNPNCFTITPITISFTAAELGQMSIQMCDNNNDGVEPNVNLTNYINNLLNNINYVGYTIHLNENDAINEVNEVIQADLTSSSTLWVNLQISEQCNQIVGPIRIRFLSAPPDRTADTIIFNDCDVNFNHREPFDWATEIPNVMDIFPGETFTVHTSLANANNDSGRQTQIADNVNPYYVRIQNANGCYTVVEVPVEVDFFGVDAVNVTENICFDGVQDITVNLNDYLEDMLIAPLEGVDISLYATNADAEGHVIENIIDPIQTITEDGYHVLTSFYVRFQISEDCYTVRAIKIRLVHPILMETPLNVCDIFNDESEENTLSIYDSYILGDQVGTVNYFLTENDATNNQNQIQSYTFTGNVTLYVRIESYGCVETYPVDFQLSSVVPSESVMIELGEVCDTNENGLTELDLTSFETEVYLGSEDVSFNYYENYNPLTQELSSPIANPEIYPVTGDIIFYVEIVEENGICSGISEVQININFSQPFEILPADLYTCDFEFDLNEEFNLNDALPQITAELVGFERGLYTIKYYKSMEDLENGVNDVGPIFTPNSALYPIYVEFVNNITGCTAIEVLTLHTVGAPKPIASSTGVCDNNINGIYDLDLNILGGLVMEGNTEGFIFTYHLSQEEAIENTRALDASVIYEADPFPDRIWVRVENALVEDCFDTNYVNMIFNPLTEIDEHELYQFSCDVDNDGYSNFDLTFVEDYYPTSQYNLAYYESLQQVNDFAAPIESPSEFINTVANNQEIIVVISSENNCPIYTTLELEVIPTPRVRLETAFFCPGYTTDVVPEVLDPSANYSYEWINSAGEIVSTEFILTDIGEEETFTLWVTDVDFPECKTPFEVEVRSYQDPVIQSIIVEGNTITVIATGSFPIEYSMDGINWQGLNYFTDLPVGPHTFWVRYIAEGCVSDPKRGLILNIPNVITPNGDGYNDYIRVDDLDVFEGAYSTFQIYDRYGKMIFQEQSNTFVQWDGKYLGRVLNSTDYWYVLILPDGRKYRGHFTVKNY